MEKDDAQIRELVHHIGTRIAELRRRKQWTQREVADRIPMHLAQYRHIEQGRRDVLVGTLHRIARTLRVPLATLFRKPRTERPGARPTHS
jgi:transcriptional regulator with XRE-family HTH domain